MSFQFDEPDSDPPTYEELLEEELERLRTRIQLLERENQEHAAARRGLAHQLAGSEQRRTHVSSSYHQLVTFNRTQGWMLVIACFLVAILLSSVQR